MRRLTSAQLARRIGLALLLAVGLTSQTTADDSLPLDTVKALKKATLLVKVPRGKSVIQGSGWLLKADKETGYLVTNFHVIVDAPKGKDDPEARVVFDSGTDGEKEVVAEVVATRALSDLALLRVKGVKGLPVPIEPTDKELTETTPVTVFGFPFTGLDQGNNPPVTVTKGAVSSVRKDGIVQLDTNLNPGNSGGPVVDAKGKLVGIAFARAKGKDDAILQGIGFAVPATDLTQLLAPRIVDSGVVPKGVKGGRGKRRCG